MIYDIFSMVRNMILSKEEPTQAEKHVYSKEEIDKIWRDGMDDDERKLIEEFDEAIRVKLNENKLNKNLNNK